MLMAPNNYISDISSMYRWVSTSQYTVKQGFDGGLMIKIAEVYALIKEKLGISGKYAALFTRYTFNRIIYGQYYYKGILLITPTPTCIFINLFEIDRVCH